MSCLLIGLFSLNPLEFFRRVFFIAIQLVIKNFKKNKCKNLDIIYIFQSIVSTN